jgi:hypothetical protein
MPEDERSAMETRLREALEERDRALSELADVRAELNALRLKLLHPGEPPPGAWGGGAGSEALPLRYRLADSLNDAAKRVLGPGHAAARGVADRLRLRRR